MPLESSTPFIQWKSFSDLAIEVVSIEGVWKEFQLAINYGFLLNSNKNFNTVFMFNWLVIANFC